MPPRFEDYPSLIRPERVNETLTFEHIERVATQVREIAATNPERVCILSEAPRRWRQRVEEGDDLAMGPVSFKDIRFAPGPMYITCRKEGPASPQEPQLRYLREVGWEAPPPSYRVKAASLYYYQPGTLNGRPVQVRVRVPQPLTRYHREDVV